MYTSYSEWVCRNGAFSALYSLQKLHQIGLSLGGGSEIRVHQPWITNENGYTTSVTGVLEGVVITSDLSYPHLASATSLQVCCCQLLIELVTMSVVFVQLNVELCFPRLWNSMQHWDMQLTASQVEVSVLFSYIDFINGEWPSATGVQIPLADL